MRRPGPLLAAVLLLAACSQQASPTSTFPARIAVGERPVVPAYGSGSIWVPNSADGTVTRVDERSGRVLATITVGDPANLVGRGCLEYGVHGLYSGSFEFRLCDMPSAAAGSEDGIWVTDNADQAVARIDPARNRVQARIPVGLDLWGIAAGAGMVWATDYLTSTVVRIDPVNDTVAARIPVPSEPTGVAIAADGVWVVCTQARVAVRIDPATNTITGQVPTGDAANAMEAAIAFGSLWVMNEAGGTLYRFDERTGAAQGTVQTLARAGRNGVGGMAALRGRLWLGGLHVQAVDPATMRVAAVADSDGIGVTAGRDAVWATTLGGYLVRIDPARVRPA